MTLRNLYYNYTGYPNYYAPGGNLGFQEVTEEGNPDLYNEQLTKQKGENKFLNAMNSSGGGGWAAAIGPAATNATNALLDTEASAADRVAGALGISNLAKIWKADTAAGDANLKLAQQNLDNFNKTYIQDASSAWGGANAVKLNNQQTIAPISNSNLKNLSWKDFRGNMFAKGAAATLQGAAAGSVGGPWGALGGAIVGLAGSLFGGIGARKRAKAAYADYQAKLGTIMSAQNSAYKQAMTNQSLSNMQALANGNTQQRINDMANIRAYGGNLFDGGGDLTNEQQMILADIQADPRILFTPKYSQWRDYIRRTSPDYLDRLYASLPYEQQQDIYQNDREAWGALSNKAKGDFGGTQVRKKTDEVSPYVAGALGLVGAMPAIEAVTMFPMLENGLNAYFGYEGAKNLPTAVTDAYDYAKKGDWSRAGLSAGEAMLDGMFIGNGIKGIKNLSELSGLSNRVYNTFPILDPYTTSGATFGYHGTSALDRLLGTISRRNGFTYKPEVPEFHRRLRISEPNDMRFDENGNFILSSGRTGEGHDGIVNFATSEPARGHKSHKTLSGIDDYIVNPKALKNQEFISIEPSDTFFETGELAINPKDITLVSGNTKLLDYTKSKGFNTLSSPRLREYYKKNYAEPTISSKNSNKLSITKEGANVSPRDVGDEIQRLTSKRGTPTLEDYRFFENETGLPSGVVPIEEYNSIGQQALYGHSPSLRANLNWNNVAYDPATQVESLYRKAKINPDDAEAVKKYNDYIDNLKRINNTEYAMGGNLYTDLSPNMMSLWNNKQQIDQQKVNMQQMNFGLGNSFNQKLNTFDFGGSMNGMDLPTGMQSYENGGTHEENPYGGIQVGVDQQGNPNLVEEGEFRWGDYVFSDRINVDPTLLSRYNLAPATKHQGKKANKGKLSYADMAKKYAKKNKELANDPIGKNTLEAYMKRLQDAQEDQKFQDSIEQQKQDAINQCRNALTTPQQGNPMYGAMKYNGMGNAATQQGVNAGMSDLGQQDGGNEVLSNTNRSGNNMLHAFGGNLYWRGSFLKKDPPPYGDPNSRIDYAMNYMGTPTYNGNSRIDFANQYMTDAGGTNDYGVSDFMNRIYSGNVGFGSPKANTTVAQTQTPQNFQEWALWQHDNGNKPYVGSVNTGVEPDAFALQAQGRIANGSTANADYTTGYNGATNTNTGSSGLTGNTNTGNTTTGTYDTNAFKEDREGIPLYNTSGKFATFGKGLTPMIYDWMNKTNTKYDPKQKPANELVDMGNNSTFLRTADTIGGYRAPNLMDAERMNNAAQAQSIAALQAALNVGNSNRGFAAAQTAQNAYNTQMGIGNNYATAQQANNEERYKTDAFNTAIDQFNANARNTSYQDNQRAEQVGQQMALSAKQAANDYLQKENWYADRTNRTAMDNRATNQAAWTDNALNYFITQAQENAERNRQNNDITKRYWSDKDGVMHYIGDSGLNGKIREYFRKNKIDNGTFTGDRLAAFNSIIQNNSAKDVANEKGELWSTVQGLMDDEIAARNKETADADKAKADELQEYRDQFDSELAQLGRYAANKDIYGNYWTSSGDLDYYGKEGFRDSQSLSQLKRAIEMLRTHNDRYNKWTPQNVTAYGGRINNGNKSNKNGYYTYTY